MAFTLFKDEIAELLILTEFKKCNNTQNILLDEFYLHFEENLQEKTSVYIMCRETGQSFEESLRGSKHVKNLEIFWMNIKTVIEFGFPMMRRMT